jgi:hypothetical protein
MEQKNINSYGSERAPDLTGLQAGLGWNGETSTEVQLLVGVT